LHAELVVVLIASFFIVLMGYFGIMIGTDAYASADCERQSDCPSSSSEESENDNNDDESGNIEEEIPSVIPFL
jgi:hypothetical protein